MRPPRPAHGLLLLLSLLAAAATTTTATATTTTFWRPAPLRAAPLAVAVTPGGGLALTARLVTWDGWFRDEYFLPAGACCACGAVFGGGRKGDARLARVLLFPGARAGGLNPPPSIHHPSIHPHTHSSPGTKLRDAAGDQWALSRDVALTLAPPTPADADRIRTFFLCLG
jgi:hypothetical protein